MSTRKSQPKPEMVNYESMYADLSDRHQLAMAKISEMEQLVFSLSNTGSPRPTKDLPFQQALTYLQEGARVRRHGWAQGIVLDGTLAVRLLFTEYFSECQPNLQDLLATDWELY